MQQAKGDLSGIAETPESLSGTGGREAARDRLSSAASQISRAHRLLHHDPLVVFAAVVPVVRGQRSGLFRLVDDAGAAVYSGRVVLDELSSSADALHLRQGGVPLDRLSRLAMTSRLQGEHLRALDRPSSGLWQPLRRAREQFDALDQRVATRLTSTADGLAAASSFLGNTGPRHYFLALENNAEMRDGGMILSYGTVAASDGHLTVGRTGRIGELALSKPAAISVPPGTAEVFHEIAPAQLWQSTTATADFAFSGRSMVEMYREATGQTIDGVVALDVPALASLLDVIGPVQIAGFAEPITSANVVQILLHDFYSAVSTDDGSSNGQRIEHNGEVASAIAERLTHGDIDAIALARHLAAATAGRHIQLYSAHAAEETEFEKAAIGGGPALVLPDRTFHVAVESRLSSKVDYYLRTSIHQDVNVLANGDAIVHTAVTVANTAPNGPPSYQLGPNTVNPGQSHGPGDYVAWMLCWSPAGSSQPGGVTESGLELGQRIELFHPGETRSVTFDTYLPAAVRQGQLQLRFVPQAHISPDDLSVSVSAPGWAVTGGAYHGPLDRTRVLSWVLHH